jgi:hypothetical protein
MAAQATGAFQASRRYSESRITKIALATTIMIAIDADSELVKLKYSLREGIFMTRSFEKGRHHTCVISECQMGCELCYFKENGSLTQRNFVRRTS